MKFVISEIAQGFRRNLSMVVSVVLVTFISLTFVGTASLLQMQIGQMKNYWYDRAQVAIYMCSDVSASDVCPQGEASADLKAKVEEKLQSKTLKPYIEKFYFENHEQAYKTFQQQFEGNAVAKYVTANQLNETFWVNLKEAAELRSAHRLRARRGRQDRLLGAVSRMGARHLGRHRFVPYLLDRRRVPGL